MRVTCGADNPSMRISKFRWSGRCVSSATWVAETRGNVGPVGASLNVFSRLRNFGEDWDALVMSGDLSHIDGRTVVVRAGVRKWV
jgi:hypothetical protein